MLDIAISPDSPMFPAFPAIRHACEKELSLTGNDRFLPAGIAQRMEALSNEIQRMNIPGNQFYEPVLLAQTIFSIACRTAFANAAPEDIPDSVFRAHARTEIDVIREERDLDEREEQALRLVLAMEKEECLALLLRAACSLEELRAASERQQLPERFSLSEKARVVFLAGLTTDDEALDALATGELRDALDFVFVTPVPDGAFLEMLEQSEDVRLTPT